jgi:hypothetical protein
MRQQAFMLFDLGMRPTDVTEIIDLRQTTAFRYFQQWKQLPPFLETKYKVARRCFRKLNHKDRGKIAQILAQELGTWEGEVSAHMRKPWAIKQIVTGEWRHWRVNSIGARRKTVLNKAVQVLVSLRFSKEVKFILQMAMNQNISPFEE